MHREFDATESPFQPRSHLSLYALTGLLAALMIADLWPLLVSGLQSIIALPTWPSRELYGVRFALMVAVLGGARVLYGSLEALTRGKVGADLAVAIACLAAILMGEPLIAAEVVFIGLVGECLEAFTFDRTQRALGKLTELFPQRCWVLRDGVEVRTRTADLAVGDGVVIKSGGRIPVDGPIIAGSSSVDSAALTGESLPKELGIGDRAFAGSVVLDGTLTVRAERVQRETIAGRIIDSTGEAIKTKLTAERLADKLAKWFLPIVLGLATLTFAANVFLQLNASTPNGPKPSFASASRLALYPTLAVLVVACPCALVLATPAAVIAALGRLAGTGILLKSGAALERIAAVTGFAFDKTGTLTEGLLEVGDVEAFDGSREALLRLAASAEQGSEHPIAKAIRKAVDQTELLTTEQFREFPGGGIEASIAGDSVRIGSAKFLAGRGLDVPSNATDAAERFETTCQSVVFVAKNDVLAGLIGVRDRPRPEAFGVLTELRELGFKPLVLLTGDRATAAAAVAKELPLDEIRAELLPQQKADAIQANMAYVGDGINDAPALARAAVGLAVGTGTDYAAAAGDVVLMGEPLRHLPLLVRLSRETVRILRQNILWFGFAVNLVGIAIAGLLWPLFASSSDWYDRAPLFGVIYHQIGSVAVLLNSMRLLAFERAAPSRLRGALAGLDRWMATIHVDDLFHELIHRWKAILFGLLLLGLVAWIATGLVVIGPNEIGVAQRFGAVHGELPPGLHIGLPWPIDIVTRVKPDEVRTVEIGFRWLGAERTNQIELARTERAKLRPNRKASDASAAWASSHEDNIARLTDESLILTGDGELIELLATVRYTVPEPAKYLRASAEPDRTVRLCAEAVFRDLAASREFQPMLGSARPAFESDALVAVKSRLDEVAPDGLGLRIEGLTIHDLHPPQDVVGAYHAVAEAIQKRDRTINEAKSEASRLVAKASDDALRTVRTAEADAHRKTSEAKAASDVFLQWHRSRTTLTDAEERAAGDDPVKREQLLLVKRGLTDLRLALEAAANALKTRPKVLIDGDKFPGTRKLFLLDPDFLPKAVPPMAFPRPGPADQRDPP